MSKANIVIRMGAPHWDARVRSANGDYITFDFRSMTRRDRQQFNRTLVQEFRKVGRPTRRKAA